MFKGKTKFGEPLYVTVFYMLTSYEKPAEEIKSMKVKQLSLKESFKAAKDDEKKVLYYIQCYCNAL